MVAAVARALRNRVRTSMHKCAGRAAPIDNSAALLIDVDIRRQARVLYARELVR